MRNSLLMALLLCCCLALSCMEEFECPVPGQKETFSVVFDPKPQQVSRSIIAPDETNVYDFNICLYSGGQLVNHAFSDSGEAVTIDLNAQTYYNVYVLANIGQVEPCVTEEEMAEYVYSVSELYDIEEVLPYAGVSRNVSVSRSGERVCILMQRLVSKIFFSVDKSALESLKIRSVRLCQSALCVRPFKAGGSAAVSAEEIADGDFCTSRDLELLNSGSEVNFFALENCQGVLLPENEEPWEKIPSSLDEEASLATYIEVDCSFDESGICDGDVTYRLYLGQDNCKDFNIIRNSILRVRLCLTIDGLKEEVTWRVDPDYSLRDGFASGWVSRGRHNEDDLYVGEKFEYRIWLSDEMLDYIGHDIQDCELFFRPWDSDDEGYIRFSEIKGSEDSAYYVEATCLRPAEGEICIREKGGRFLSVLSDNVCVNVPGIIISDKPSDAGNVQVPSCDGAVNCDINAEGKEYYMYLVDCELLNLNVSSGCGYDLSVFDFDMDPELSGSDKVLTTIRLSTASGVSGKDSPALIFRISCTNEGDDHYVNSALLAARGRSDVLSWNISESVCAMDEDIKVRLESMPVTMTLVDNAQAGYGDSRYAMVVDNPSRLPLKVNYWQFVTVNRSYDASLKELADAKVKDELFVNSMDYVVHQYNDSSLPVYGSAYSFLSERNSNGTPAVEDGNSLVYNLKGIDPDNLIAALTYDGWGFDSISHHMTVSFSDGSPVYDLTVDDRLDENLNDRGIWLYIGTSLILSPDRTFEKYPELNPYNLQLLKSQTPVVGNMAYDTEDNRLYITAYSLGGEGIILDSITEASADGYVQTHPNGTWGKAQDNSCHETVVRYCDDFYLWHEDKKVVPDGNAVRDVFQAIYRNSYFDSWNNIGSANNYMHSAHPTSLSIKMAFKLSDINETALHSFKPIFPAYIHYFHEQDALDYRITTNFSYTTFRFVEVKEK